jgi:outer membrane biogenesis lipoprotein LolB
LVRKVVGLVKHFFSACCHPIKVNKKEKKQWKKHISLIKQQCHYKNVGKKETNTK